MAAVVAAENNRVAARQRATEEGNRLKGTIRDRKSLWENEIVSKELCQGLYSFLCFFLSLSLSLFLRYIFFKHIFRSTDIQM